MIHRTIHKFALLSGGITEVVMPVGSVVLSVHNQGERLTLWAEVDDGHPISEPVERVRKIFFAAVTGGLVPKGPSRFLGTVLFHGGSYVAHVYEMG
jgi:hypothetical protein